MSFLSKIQAAKKKVFLGGTCNDSTWREELKPLLKILYFDPVVKDWTPECQKRELEERASADFCLYTITPKMTGVYSIAEVVDDSNKRPASTVFCLLDNVEGQKFEPGAKKSLESVAKLVAANGAQVFRSLAEVANFLNEG